MTRKKAKRSLQEIKELIGEEKDILRPLINAVLQEVLEAEMSEALRAEKSERVESRLGFAAAIMSVASASSTFSTGTKEDFHSQITHYRKRCFWARGGYRFSE